jgi:hypothetical protein
MHRPVHRLQGRWRASLGRDFIAAGAGQDRGVGLVAPGSSSLARPPSRRRRSDYIVPVNALTTDHTDPCRLPPAADVFQPSFVVAWPSVRSFATYEAPNVMHSVFNLGIAIGPVFGGAVLLGVFDDTKLDRRRDESNTKPHAIIIGSVNPLMTVRNCSSDQNLHDSKAETMRLRERLMNTGAPNDSGGGCLPVACRPSTFRQM